MNIISQLESRIAADCKTVDREERFDAMLDECYSFDKVGGPFACMSPSRVLKEVDPVAYRCGVNDYADGEGWVEIGGEHYEQTDCENKRDEMVEELQNEISDLEDELSDEQDEEEVDTAEIEAIQAKIDAASAKMHFLNSHSF